MAFIEIRGLKYRYPRAAGLQLDGITADIEKGSFTGIIGRNGSGKSTLAEAILGLVPQFYKGAYGGSVTVDGLDASRTPVSSMCRKVGLVFQNPFNQLSGANDTVFGEICFGMQNTGVPAPEMRERAEEVMEMLGISEFRNRNPFDLSGGQMQRAAIASILVMRPDAIILDEPTSQLDPAGSEEVFRAVDDLRRTGLTILMIEQKIERVAEYSDMIMLMDGGKLIASGSPSEVLSRDDLEEHGVRPPLSLRTAKTLSFRCSGGTYPVTEKEAAGLMRGKIVISEEESGKESHIPDTTAENAVMEVRNLSFSYTPGTEVLHGVSLSFDSRRTAVIGQNGAGKTTLAKLLKGLLKPSEGNILFHGEDTAGKSVASLAGKIGYVFQNPDDQIFKPNVLDEVMFGPLNIGMHPDTAEMKAKEALSMVSLDGKEGRNPFDLDLHERKMVALASVIAMDTEVLILDEPTIAQDDDGKLMVSMLIHTLSERGKLVISILHDMDLVASSFERVIAMAGGKVIADGEPAAVFADSGVLSAAGLELPHAASLGRSLGAKRIFLTDSSLLHSVHRL